MRFDVLTLFPDIIYGYLSDTILNRAQKNNLIRVVAHNFRQFSGNQYGHVDDKPYGGGPGMVLRAEPIFACLKSLGLIKKNKKAAGAKTKIVMLEPSGQKFNQKMATDFSKLDRLVLICGRYEGFDARLYDFVDERVSVGDYVVAGGELPALSIIEATSRLIPGVLGNQESLQEETFTSGNAEYPQYTRPESFLGKNVPPVLLSGDHKKIAAWRKKQTK